jgi:hypothetical protein
MLHLTQLQGGAGGSEAISPALDINLAAFESSLRGYLDGDDTQQAFDVVSRTAAVCACVLQLLLNTGITPRRRPY